MTTNQGRNTDLLWKDLTWADIKAAADALWLEARHHPGDASCECPAVEAVAVLYERGYRLVPMTEAGESE